MFASYTLLTAVALTLAPAQSVLSGRVVDADTGSPIADARVTLLPAGTAIEADDEGAFVLPEPDAGGDTLVVAHESFLELRVLMAESIPEALRLALVPWRISNPDSVVATADIQELLVRIGGVLWQPQDFVDYADRVVEPLDLLIFSGFARAVRDGCVELHGSLGCATVLVNGVRGNALALIGRFPAEVDAFVIGVPGAAAPGEPSDPAGVVGVFLQNRAP